MFILYYCVQQPSHYDHLPIATDFQQTLMMIGIAMYAYEGQTMILPIENKLENPADFLSPCGVLPVTMVICTALMTAIGFFGYNAFGDKVQSTITLNMPDTPYKTVYLLLYIHFCHSKITKLLYMYVLVCV